MPRPMPPPFNDRELAAWGGMLHFHAQITDELSRALEQTHGLRLGEYEVLTKLAMTDRGLLPMSELYQRTFLTRSQSGLSRLVHRLCERSMLERVASLTEDQRNVTVKITNSGRRVVEVAALEHAKRVRARYFEVLTEAEVTVLARVWPKLLSAPK